MTNSWRPEGWVLSIPFAQFDKDFKKGEIATARVLTPEEVALFEAGADAMLEALRERYNPRLLTPLSPLPLVFTGGKLVLIPDDEEAVDD